MATLSGFHLTRMECVWKKRMKNRQQQPPPPSLLQRRRHPQLQRRWSCRKQRSRLRKQVRTVLITLMSKGDEDECLHSLSCFFFTETEVMEEFSEPIAVETTEVRGSTCSQWLVCVYGVCLSRHVCDASSLLQFINRQFIPDGTYSSSEKEQVEEWSTETEVRRGDHYYLYLFLLLLL